MFPSKERPPLKRYGKVSFFGFGPMSLLDGKAYRLKGELETFSSVTEPLRRQFQEEVKGLPQFLNMNMAILALALVILHELELEGKITEGGLEVADLRALLDYYVDSEYSPKVKEEAEIGQRKKEDILRYIRVILFYREERHENLY